MSYYQDRMSEIQSNPDLVSARRKRQEPEKPSHGRLGWVYFIINPQDEAVKIGFTTKRTERLICLQTGSHRKLHMECTFPAREIAERMLHKRFAKHRIRGEWFDLVWEMEELWDDMLDYQGLRCAGRSETMRSAGDLIDDMDQRPVDIEHLQFILKTIGKPWPPSFVAQLRVGGCS